MSNLAKCSKCGWVHFEVSRDYAQHEVDQFNKYFLTLAEEKKQQFYGNRTSNILDYERCFKCSNSYKDFQDVDDSDVLNGVTLQPIIIRKD